MRLSYCCAGQGFAHLRFSRKNFGRFKRRPYKIKRRKPILKNPFLGWGIFVLVVLLGVFYSICFWDFFQIEKIEISGNQKVKTEDIKNLIEKEISKNFLFFSSKSIFLANLRMIEKNLLEEYPRLAEANLEKDFPRCLKVKIKERTPVAIFIQAQPNFAEQNLAGQEENSFFIDKEGVVFSSVKSLSKVSEDSNDVEGIVGKKMLKIKNLILKEEVKLGERVIEKEALAQILEVERKLKENLEILGETAEIVSERRLNFKTSENWEIYFSRQKDIDWQITELGLILEKLERQALPGKRENLEYIDLRFDKVSYKCK